MGPRSGDGAIGMTLCDVSEAVFNAGTLKLAAYLAAPPLLDMPHT